MRTKKQKAVWKKWYIANKEIILKKKSIWQKKNREKINEYQVAWHHKPENEGKNRKYVVKCLKKAKKEIK